ncbi:hypothetical protein CN971_30160, partial [Bacillus thuringiensis]
MMWANIKLSKGGIYMPHIVFRGIT